MTTTEYLQREIRRTELSMRRAAKKPNTPPEELRGLHEKLEHLQEALEAVNDWAKHGFKGRVYVCRNCGRITWRNTKVSIQPKDKNVCAFCAFESKE